MKRAANIFFHCVACSFLATAAAAADRRPPHALLTLLFAGCSLSVAENLILSFVSAVRESALDASPWMDFSRYVEWISPER
jgi:hypothetical protein